METPHNRPYSLSPLMLASAEELVAELQRRFDACVVFWLEVENGQECMTVAWEGGRYTCLGMAREFER